MNKKLTINLSQGTLGKLHPRYELLVKNKRNVGHIQSIVNILAEELEVRYEVASSVMHLARSKDSPEMRIQGLTEALIGLASEAIVKNSLHTDIPEKEFAKKLKIVTTRWAEDIVTKIRTLPELRRKKLLSDRKCRLKNYIKVCPVCDATEDNIIKDYTRLSAECKKCGWKRVFDGSGKRTVPKKTKPKTKSKKKTKKTGKNAGKEPTTDATKENIRDNHKDTNNK